MSHRLNSVSCCLYLSSGRHAVTRNTGTSYWYETNTSTTTNRKKRKHPKRTDNDNRITQPIQSHTHTHTIQQQSTIKLQKMYYNDHGKIGKGVVISAYTFDTRARRRRRCPVTYVRPSLSATRLSALPGAPFNDILLPETAAAIMTTSIDAVPQPSQSFEPIVNVPAMLSSVFIASIFGALIFRTNQVERAVQERNERLQELRAYKSKQLANSNNNGTIESSTGTDADLTLFLQRYEEAVQKEEKLRNVLPWTSRIRIVAPSGGRAEEQQARADARRFLGKDYDIGSSSSSSSLSSLSSSEASSEEADLSRNDVGRNRTDDQQKQNLPVWPLAFVVLSQLALIIFFTSLQDAATTSPFNESVP